MLIPTRKGQNENLNVAECGRGVGGRSGQQSQRGNKLGGKMNLLKEKFDFLRSIHFKLFRQI